MIMEHRMQSAFTTVAALNCAETALFLDFDGTLTPIVDRPDRVRVDHRIIDSLGELTNRLRGALAVVSGRDIADLDRYLSPHVFRASGVHGLELRIEGRDIRRLEINETALVEAVAKLEAVAKGHDDLLLERKPGSVALHYRACPDLYGRCKRAVADAVDGQDGLFVVEGKMVIEVKGHNGSKGTAIEAFMAHPPFLSRRPVFLGDDVTDEEGFVVVNALGGTSIKVGGGETVARHRLNDPADVADWLEMLIQEWEVAKVEGEAAT